MRFGESFVSFDIQFLKITSQIDEILRGKSVK